MLTDQDKNTVYLSDLLPARHPDLAATLENIFREERVQYGYLHGTKDIWCRDYMPIQIGVGQYLRYMYFPDYLRGEHEHLITDIDTVQGLPFKPSQVTTTDFLIDGGNVVHHRRYACMTDKMYRENPEVDREALRTSLQALLGVEIIVIPKEPYDFIGHADGILRFVDETSVIVNDYHVVDPSYHERLVSVLGKNGLGLIFMPYKPPSNSRDAESAWGNYVNFLQVGRLVLFPKYDIDTDDEAEAVLKGAFPNTKLIGMDCRDLSKEGGVLNCVTWNIQQ